MFAARRPKYRGTAPRLPRLRRQASRIIFGQNKNKDSKINEEVICLHHYK